MSDELLIKFYRKYGNSGKQGIREFINIIQSDNEETRQKLKKMATDDADLIWYPGCGGDVSPCSILERKNFEKEKGIAANNNRIYVFNDYFYVLNDKNIYDCSVEDCKKCYSIENNGEIYIEGMNHEKIIEGYLYLLSLGKCKCNILFFKMSMEDFLYTAIREYKLPVKWMFFLKMDPGSFLFFERYNEFAEDLPQWICINRVETQEKIKKYVDLKPMKRENAESYYIDVDREEGCDNVSFGQMKKLKTTKINNSIVDGKIREVISVLDKVNIICKDNGKYFDSENSEKIEKIKEVLKGKNYSIDEGELFLLCRKKELKEYDNDTIVISTHIDCKQPSEGETGITRCFSRVYSENLLLGTYDNSITNAAVLYLMLQDALPDNVIVAFTGDGEGEFEGAEQVTAILNSMGIDFKCIVADVTNGSLQSENVKVENNLWSDYENIPTYILDILEDRYNAEECNHQKEHSECLKYYDNGISTVGLFLPTSGDMHSDDGIFVKKVTLKNYIDILQLLANETFEIPEYDDEW